MRNPDFFILGAPKCGTTALSEYLGANDKIFMSFPKEPNYYCTDLPEMRQISDIKRYKAMFADAGPEHQAVGEASVHYLRSEVAVKAVCEAYTAPRFIVMVRDPITFLPSWHNQLLYSLSEDQKDFAMAWRLQDARKRGENIPKTCRSLFLLDYAASACFGAQVKRLLDQVPRDRVLFLQFEEFFSDIRSSYIKTLDFLGVDDDGCEQFGRVNTAHQHKSRLGGWVLSRGYRMLSTVNPLPRNNPIRRALRSGFIAIKSTNTSYRRPDAIDEGLAAEIRETLADDASLLYDLAGIDYRR